MTGAPASIGKINRWTGKFADPAVEASFQRDSAERNRRSNDLALMIALPLNAAYVFFDPFLLTDPVGAIRIRVAAVAIVAMLYAALRTSWGRRSHESLTAAAMLILGGAMNAIMWNEPSLAGDYYVGLIQGAVFMSFAVRIGLARLVSVFAVTLAAFYVVAFSRGRAEEAMLQCLATTTMYFVCAFGVYLLESMRRSEYGQSRTIALQNEKLNQMLADVQQDNARKVAAMNLLVHFVKTPIHQIVGFTDVIKRQIESGGANESRSGTLESADFIQSASRDLLRSVSKLLSYYRLDEKASAEPDLIELDALILDHLERLPSPPPMQILERVAIVNRTVVVGDAIQTMIDRYVDDQEASRLSEVRLERSENAATLVFVDQGPAVTDEEFARLTKPLDKLDHYLTANGSSMLLGLRTVARAVEICGGAITHRHVGGRNFYFIAFRDLASNAALNAPKVA